MDPSAPGSRLRLYMNPRDQDGGAAFFGDDLRTQRGLVRILNASTYLSDTEDGKEVVVERVARMIAVCVPVPSVRFLVC
jgi:hypothetical protein